MANALPILLLGGAAALFMMGGKKKAKLEPKEEPEPEPKEEPGIEVDTEHEAEPWDVEPGLEMEDRDVVCLKETGGGVSKSMKIENAILDKEGLWSTEIYKALKPEAGKELTGGSWLPIESQEKLVLAVADHVNTLPLNLVPQGWGLSDEAFRESATPVIVESLLAPCTGISSKTTMEGGSPSPENLFMDSAIKLARAIYIDAGVKTRGDTL